MQSLRLACCFLLSLVAGVYGCSSAPPKSGEEQIRASAADLRETLKVTVKDDQRLRQMLAITDQAATQLEGEAAEFARLRKEQDRLNADYNATRDDLRVIGERMQSAREAYRSNVIGTRQALAQLATDDEWKKIISRDAAILGN